MNYGQTTQLRLPTHTHTATPDVLDKVVVKNFVLPMQLTVFSALISVDLPTLIDTTCRSSFHKLSELLDLGEWPELHSRPALKSGSPGNPW
jgi:hypothetical protein